MLTLAITSIVLEVANKWTDVTGGADGLHSVPIQPVLGMFRFDMFGKTAFLYCLAVVFVGWWLVRTHRAIRPSAWRSPACARTTCACSAIGAPVYRRRLTAYTISAALAGVAGALLTQTTQFVGLSVLGFELSGEVLVMLMLGGVRRIYGAFVGPVVYIVAQRLPRQAVPRILVSRHRSPAGDHRDVRARRHSRHPRQAGGARAAESKA